MPIISCALQSIFFKKIMFSTYKLGSTSSYLDTMFASFREYIEAKPHL
jgi:hypothetical protein